MDRPVTRARVNVELTSGLPNSVRAAKFTPPWALDTFWVLRVKDLVVRLGHCLTERVAMDDTHFEVFEETDCPSYYERKGRIRRALASTTLRRGASYSSKCMVMAKCTSSARRWRLCRLSMAEI